MDEKAKDAEKIIALTEDEENELVKIVNKMTTIFEFIQRNMHNTQWMDTDHAPLYKGLAGGLAFIHTRTLVKYTITLTNLTQWLKGLTISLVALTIVNIVVILGLKLDWF